MALSTLISAQANGTSAGVELFNPHEDELQYRTVQVDGTWAGATATIELSGDNTNWCAVDHAGAAHFSATANAQGLLASAGGQNYARLVVSGGGGTESINLKVVSG